MISDETFYALMRRVQILELEKRELEARFAIMEAFFIKEFPKYFAGEAALVLAPDGENLGGEILPDIHPIDLRTEAEKEAGETYQLSDLVDMGAAHAEA